MELLAKIIQEQKIKEGFWKYKYTFLDIQTSKIDYFRHNKKINYTPKIIGKLKLFEDNGLKFYQLFNQDEFIPSKENEKEKTLTWLEKNASQNIEKLTNKFAKKIISFEPSELVEILESFHETYKTWKKAAKKLHRTDRTLRNWRKLADQPPKVPKKKGRKSVIYEDDFLLLLFLTNSPKYNTETQKWKSDYIFEETGRRYSQQVLSYNLKKYSELTGKRATKRYSEQDLEEIWKFLKEYGWLYSLPNCLAVDEFSVRPGETPRIAWSRRGCPAIVKQKGQRGVNHTLFLCVRNVEKGAVVSRKLFKNEKKKIKDKKTGKVRIKKGTDTTDFYDFLKNIELPTSEKYYLLLDNSSIHDPPNKRPSKILKEADLLSMEELAKQKNIELVYLPRYTPEINPIELCFNTTRHFIENLPTDTEEELEQSVDKIIDMINEKDLTKYFRHCQEFFSFGKSGN
ncbi:MAG: transposase [Mycoplasmataceae bacterium CE_OT135]|nr:MAG: transposase [Mycoplasmataceae bacterium CE_OT135]